MPSDHDHRCQHCYDEGKYDAYFEFINAIRLGHPHDCNCDPCYSARAFIFIYTSKRKVANGRSDNPWVVDTLKVAHKFVSQMITMTAKQEIEDVLSHHPEVALLITDSDVHNECEAIANKLMETPTDVSQEWVGYVVQMMGEASNSARLWANRRR